MGGQLRLLPGSPAAGLLITTLHPSVRYSGSAEYQTRRRVNVDVADRYPLHQDIVEASIWLGTPVALEQAILLLIISASLGCFPSVAHFWSVIVSHTPALLMMVPVLLPGYWTKVVPGIISNCFNGL
jgi:hypothetical protein